MFRSERTCAWPSRSCARPTTRPTGVVHDEVPVGLERSPHATRPVGPRGPERIRHPGAQVEHEVAVCLHREAEAPSHEALPGHDLLRRVEDAALALRRVVHRRVDAEQARVTRVPGAAHIARASARRAVAHVAEACQAIAGDGAGNADRAPGTAPAPAVDPRFVAVEDPVGAQAVGGAAPRVDGARSGVGGGIQGGHLVAGEACVVRRGSRRRVGPVVSDRRRRL